MHAGFVIDQHLPRRRWSANSPMDACTTAPLGAEHRREEGDGDVRIDRVRQDLEESI